MVMVYLGIGSNINRKYNIRSCLQQMSAQFPTICFSKLYETPAVGFQGNAFINLVAGLETDWSVEQLADWLKQLETAHQRVRSSEKFSSRTLDVDILLYGKAILKPDRDVPRDEILKYAFVLFPLAEIAGDVLHPETGLSIAEHASQSRLDASVLTEVE